ncbi:Centractin [Savitreella phatthalungensis]
MDANQPICIDNGSGTIKAGFAGGDTPQCFFPSIVGRPKHVRYMAGAVDGDHFIGRRAQELRGLLKVRYPLEHGIVTDWEDMERIWHHIYTEELRVSPEDHPILLTEAPHNPRANRDRAAEIFFETFNAPALFLSIQAVLSLYASGRTTGVVLDSGDGVTHAVPIYEGFAVPNAIRRVDVAGRDVTRYLQLLLRRNAGLRLDTSAEFEIVRDIKEAKSFVATDVAKEEKEWLARIGARYLGPPASTTVSAGGAEISEAEAAALYRLPDGQTVELGPERFRCNEVLFDPEIIGSESEGVHALLHNAVTRCDLDLRRTLLENVILSGGTTLTRGFGDRLLKELRAVSVRDAKVRIFAPPERRTSTWIGASILAGLGTFSRMWVSAAEYAENPNVIHTKCL